MTTDAPPSKADYREISCQSCGATILLESDLLSTICPYCASPSIVQRPPTENLPTPTFIIGFAIDHDRATRAVKNWIGKSHFFARSDFKRALPKLTRGVYLPAYLYGAVANSRYSASIGENYTETQTYTTRDANGKTVTRTRTVTKTEWRALHGEHSCYVVDVVVTASQGVSNDALENIEPFDLRTLRRFDIRFISGWLAEAPSRSQDECFRLAHDETVQKVGTILAGFMPGDSHQNLQYQTDLSQEVIDLTLFPIWSFAIRYDENRPPIQILVNGQTGRVGGHVPVSAAKVTAAIILGLAIIGGIIALFLLAQR